jgi:hypothetical protein
MLLVTIDGIYLAYRLASTVTARAVRWRSGANLL